MSTARLGLIGGTGLYHIEGLSGVQVMEVQTPFGEPSSPITTGKLGDVDIAFLARHGQGHTIPPGELPSTANIYALKKLGVEHIIAVNSVGSLKEDLHPGNIVIADQFIDKTTRHPKSFFSRGLVAHIAFAHPVCPALAQTLFECAREAGATARLGGVYVVMEGPAFSTRAESLLHRSWGADIIGMTGLPEARLAREAEICYSVLACITDYDTWHETEQAVSVEMVLETLKRNIDTTRQIIKLAAGRMPPRDRCGCSQALKNTIVTDPAYIPARMKEDLDLIVGKYL